MSLHEPALDCWDEIMVGWVLAASGDSDVGLEAMERRLAAWRAGGSELGTTSSSR